MTADDNSKTTNAIETIDEQIVALVRARHNLAGVLRRARAAHGVPTVQIAEEHRVARLYSSALGRHGSTVAALLIQLCRLDDSLPPPPRPTVESLAWRLEISDLLNATH
ncbi:hypothetical protein ACWD69_24985 [Micromonospora chokoriensis]